MHTLKVELGSRSYPIRIGAQLLENRQAFDGIAGRSLRVVTDSNVAQHHLAQLSRTLGIADNQVLVLPPGEAQKTWDGVEGILDWLLEGRLARDSLLVALGGGVIGDMTGFAAAIYQRGIDFVQLPTTLLAQVDSSVGGKTGVNHARGKNMIGAFHQPCLVVADTATLATLPRRELLAGVAEVIKYGMLADSDFFRWLEQNLERVLALDADAVSRVILRCCELKARIVAQDERESGPRALLNLGHTFGHAIETWTGYTEWLHGEAVAVGLCMAADLSARLSWITTEAAARCITLVERSGLPTRPPAGMSTQDFLDLMAHDKKVAAGRLRLVLLRKLGLAAVSADFDASALSATLEAFSH